MRVISGKYKGKKLFSPTHAGVRPTLDKVKESIFNILAKDIEGATVVDLFCGSGALGIEALSRGAALAIFVDSCAQSIRLTKQNIMHTKAEPSEVFCSDYRLAIKKLRDRNVDIIFLDPPYAASMLLESLKLICENNVIKAGGIIICEHSLALDFTNLMKNAIINTRKFGKTFITKIHF